MTNKKYTFINVITLIVIALLMGWAAANGYYWIAVPVFIVYGFVFAILRSRVKELMFDEREYNIAEKAGIYAYIIFLILAFVSGAILTTLSPGTPILLPIGLTLIGSACAITLFFFVAKFYFSRKMGGKE